MKRTKREIEYKAAPYPRVVRIPKGTPVFRADNLPPPQSDGYWAGPWPGMAEVEESWQRNYGFYIEAEDVV